MLDGWIRYADTGQNPSDTEPTDGYATVGPIICGIRYRDWCLPSHPNWSSWSLIYILLGVSFGGFRHVTCTSEIAGYGDPPDAPNRCHQIPIDIINQLDCICRLWSAGILRTHSLSESKKTTHQNHHHIIGPKNSTVVIRIRTWSRRRG